MSSTSTPIWVLLAVATIAAGASIIVAIVAAREQRKKLTAELEFQRKKFEEEFTTQREKLKAEYATEVSVEKALEHMLSINEFPYRSFPIIRHHIGGFESNELRRLLVRAGAVRKAGVRSIIKNSCSCEQYTQLMSHLNGTYLKGVAQSIHCSCHKSSSIPSFPRRRESRRPAKTAGFPPARE